MSTAGVGEIVVVPDFSADSALLFEARTLFFLASCLECFGEGASTDAVPRLHVCCVGEPPRSVQRLVSRAGARITVHEPIAGFFGGFANKLRGLEGMMPGERRLLLDADVLVLGALEALDGIQADFAAAAAGKPQVPQSVWESIYASLGLPLPSERMASLRGRLGLGMEAVSYRYEGQQQEAGAMLPYYNSGVLFIRGGFGLRERWEEHMRHILHLASGRTEMSSLHAVMYGDQVGFATAMHSLRIEGRTFEILPDACNARLVHLRAGALRWQDIRLFHATGFLQGLQTRAHLSAALDNDAARWVEAVREGERKRPDDGADGSGQPGRFLQTLWQRWVRPEWQ